MSSRKLLVNAPFCDKHLALIKDAAGSDFDVVIRPDALEEKEYKELLKDAEIIIGQPPIEFIQNPEVNCPKLKLIQMLWAGTDQYTRSNLPFPQGTIKLSNASGAYGQVISQHVLAMVLSLLLNFKKYSENQSEKIWQREGAIKSLDGANVLIFGAGDIGTFVAKRLSGFDTHIVGVCRDLNKKRQYFDEVCTLDEASEYLGKSDVVICAIPNSKETEGYFDENRLSLLKDGAIIVNVGRGNFIDCMALNSHLNSGHLWGAGLDVTNPEPLPLDHPLWSNPRCIITPHASGIAFGSLETTEDLICGLAVDNILRYKNEEEIINRIY